MFFFLRMTSNKSYLEKVLYSNYISFDQEISSITSSGGHEINSKNIMITLENSESFYLKIVDEFDNDMIKKIEIIDRCYQDGVKVPKIIRNNKGEIVTINENKLFLLTKHCKGEKFSFDSKEIFSAGENLAVLNKNLEKNNLLIERNKLYNDLNQEETEKIKQIIGSKKINDKKIIELIESLSKIYLEVNKKIKPYAKNKQLVHIDFHPENVLFKEKQLNYILDFDSIVTSSELQSIAFACDRFSKNTKDFITFVEGYQKQGRKLSIGEKKILPFFVEKEALCRINYIIRKQFFFEDETWSFELDKHLKILKRMSNLKNELRDKKLIGA